jgi:alginate O-acetyltransferase complex protein AlgI
VTATLSLFVLTCATWIVFRANTIGDAVYVLTHLLHDWDFSANSTEQFLARQFPVAALSLVFLEAVELSHQRFSLTKLVSQRPLIVRWSTYIAFIVGVALFGVHRASQFIYFQF